MTEREKTITDYQSALQTMREGRYDLSVVVEPGDEIGRLGQEINELARDLDRKFGEVARLQEISEEITTGTFLDDVLNKAYESFRAVIPYERMGCALLSEENRLLTAYWARSDGVAKVIGRGFQAPMAGSSLLELLRTRRPRILNDLEAYLGEHPKSTATRMILQEGIRSSLTCPLVAQGKPVGFLFFSSREKDTYRGAHQEIFLQIAGQISILVEKTRLYQQIFELNQNLLAARAQLEHQATHDALTGLHNRAAIMEHLEAEIARARRRRWQVGVVLLDVDHFKKVNDSHGHLAGDEVLRTVAARMKQCLREYDYLGRYGGEEFLVVLGDTDQERASAAAWRLHDAVGRESVAHDGKHLAVTISAGVALAQGCDGVSAHELVHAADVNLYKAKARGRDRVEPDRAASEAAS